MPGKYGDLIKKAREPEDQKTSNPDNQKAKEPDNQITRTESEQARVEKKEVNLCVKVPKSLRQHWAAEAKRQGTTMTAVIIEALTAKFGKPQ